MWHGSPRRAVGCVRNPRKRLWHGWLAQPWSSPFLRIICLCCRVPGGTLLCMSDLPRKTRRTFNEPGHAHYLTYSCYKGLPLLSKDHSRRWVIESIAAARVRHAVDVYAYVIMPQHVHLLMRPRLADYEMAVLLKALKRPVAWKAKQFLLATGNQEWLARLTVRKGSARVFRFWEAGGGFDRNVTRVEDLRPVVDYIHENPVRRGLVGKPTEWPWSSARFWSGLDGTLLEMDAVPS